MSLQRAASAACCCVINSLYVCNGTGTRRQVGCHHQTVQHTTHHHQARPVRKGFELGAPRVIIAHEMEVKDDGAQDDRVGHLERLPSGIYLQHVTRSVGFVSTSFNLPRGIQEQMLQCCNQPTLCLPLYLEAFLCHLKVEDDNTPMACSEGLSM